MVAVRVVARGVRFDVRVQPRASRSEVAGEHDGALRVRLAAPPVDGAANEALMELLADVLRVAKRDVRIVAGEASRRKVVEIDGITPEQVLALCRPEAAPSSRRPT
jgi:uncharacterized protein (TIGR00251 family)